MSRILSFVSLISLIFGCAQRVRHLRVDGSSEKPLTAPHRLRDSGFASVNPVEIVGSSRCGPRGSEEDLFEEAKKEALHALVAGRCPKKRILRADGKVTLVPSGEVVNAGLQKVRGSVCRLWGTEHMGVRIYVTLDSDRADVKCQVKGAENKSDDSL